MILRDHNELGKIIHEVRDTEFAVFSLNKVGPDVLTDISFNSHSPQLSEILLEPVINHENYRVAWYTPRHRYPTTSI
jgi:hypothetical protein